MSKHTASTFGDLPQSPPKPLPPSESWWARPDLQSDREKFAKWARIEQDRILGSQRFGGSKRVHDKFPKAPKK